MLIVAFGLNGCRSAVMIRIENLSDVDFHDVVVSFPSQTEEYGNISAQTSSDYRRVKKAYRYAYIEATINEKKVIFQPIDYSGETLLPEGNYTYRLRYHTESNSQYGRLRINVWKD